MKICQNCNKQFGDDVKYCPHCGSELMFSYNSGFPPFVPREIHDIEQNKLAIIGFICAFFVPIAGLILSIMGYKKSNELNGIGRKLSIAGIVLSAVGVFSAILIALVFSGLMVSTVIM